MATTEKKSAEINLEEIKAELMKQLKAEMLEEMEKAKAETELKESEDARRLREMDEEYVTVHLFKDGRDYKDEVFVAVNGENCYIQRGLDVKIKRKFAKVLEQSMDQDLYTAELISKKKDEFQAIREKLN